MTMTAQEAADFYGKDAAEWLQRWDSGHSVWSIEMGGLGPGYEQCIQVTAAEILRHLLAERYDASKWEDKDQWKRDLDAIESFGHSNKIIKKLGLSGAQWGAACNIALNFYQRGPAIALLDEAIKDRHIQVRRDFP